MTVKQALESLKRCAGCVMHSPRLGWTFTVSKNDVLACLQRLPEDDNVNASYAGGILTLKA